MLLKIILLLVGLALIVFGADWLVDGASAIARKLGVSEFVIGLTIVGFGTSMPELVVSLNGAFHGVSDVAVGNVVGSNFFNTLLILGLTALVMPIGITESNRKRDIPVTSAVTLLFVLMGMSRTILGIGNDKIDRIGGAVFLLVFAAYIYMSFKMDKADAASGTDGENKSLGIPAAIGLVIAGLAGLVVGGRLFVDSAEAIARMIGVSDKFIAITVLAGGTSLPELATCIVAAVKKRGQLALGNILGSNIFNILLILGCSALVTPLSLDGMSIVDMLALVVSMAVVMLSSYSFGKNKIDRGEAVVMLLCFAAYYVWLFMNL